MINPNRTNWFTPLWNTLWRLGVLALVLFIGWRVRAIIAVLLFAGTLAYALSFGVDALMKLSHRLFPRRYHRTKHARRIWSTLICFLLLGFGTYWAGARFVVPIRSEIEAFTKNLPTYQEHFHRWRDQTFTPWYQATVPETARANIDKYAQNIDYTRWSSAALSPLGSVLRSTGKLVNWFVEIVLVPILAFYFLVDGHRLKRELFEVIPGSKVRVIARICRETNRIMRAYMISQAILCLIAGLFTWGLLVSLALISHGNPTLGVGKYATMLGIYAGLTRAIPVLGPLIGGIPVTALAALAAGSHQIGILVAVLFTAMHFIESKFVMPMIVGEKLNLHAVWVILSLLVAAEFFGLIGMFFAAPVAAISRNIWQYYHLPPNLRSKPHVTRTGAVVQEHSSKKEPLL